MPNLEELQEQVQKLSRADRDQLIATLAYENRTKKKLVDLSSEEELILSTILDLTQVHIARQRFLENYGANKFKVKAEEFLGFVEPSRVKLGRHDINGVITTCLSSLAEEMKARGMPLTPRGMLDNISLLPSAVDQGFPGYAAAGFLHRIIG